MRKLANDIYQRVTDGLIAALEAGVSPWRRDWSLGNGGGMPHNANSGREYRGINLLVLLAEQYDKGYSSTGWITPRKAIEAGLNFKGQKTTEVIFWKRTSKTETNSDTGERETRNFLFARSYRVLNLDQCEGDKSKLKGNGSLEVPDDIADKLVPALKQGLDIDVRHGGDRAFYSPTHDFIQMPPQKAFKSETGYRATFLHEGVHATGHKSRCERDFSGRFGTEAYAFEELVAEIGCCFLQEILGIKADVENHASYLETWLEVLKGDKRAIFTAASKAQQAADYILDALDIKELPDYSEAEKEAA